jgi:hypothetical protein
VKGTFTAFSAVTVPYTALFSVPPVTGCGHVVDRRLGLPSPSGTNFYEQTVHVQLRSY